MKVFIAGLGLIGSSYALALSSKGHDVFGYDTHEASMIYAKEHKFVKQTGIEFLGLCDLVILAFYPKDNVSFVKTHIKDFKENQVITDVAGTKTLMVSEIEQLLPPLVYYCSHHPMAGKEKKGIKFADKDMFKKANFIVVPTSKTNERAINMITELGLILGFGRQTIVDKNQHDQLIAYTSQLPHAIAVALMNSGDCDKTDEFTGDSFRDLTRIAMINEALWSELFFENKRDLLKEINKFEQALDVIKESLEKDDLETLKKVFITARERREQFK